MRFIFLVAATLFILSCGTGSNQANSEALSNLEELETEVMRIHDEAMLGMSDIRAVKKELTALQNEKTSERDDEMIIKARKNLTAADSLMWDWMHNYKKPSFENVEKAESYLSAEFQKIKTVDSLMNSSVENGMKIIAQLKPE